MTKRLVEVPFEAPLTRETDPLWFVKRSVWTPRMLATLRQGGPEGGRWYWLHDKVFKKRTMQEAFTQVAANDGAPGVDGVTVKAFGMRLDEEIGRILEAWRTGTFRPQAILRKWIPKPGSKEKRPLGLSHGPRPRGPGCPVHPGLDQAKQKRLGSWRRGRLRNQAPEVPSSIFARAAGKG
jgi:hypothetical protein